MKSFKKRNLCPFKRLIELSKTDFKEIKTNSNWIKAGYESLSKAFPQNLKKDQASVDSPDDFDTLLKIWGIEPDEIKAVIKAMYIRAFSFFVVAVIGGFMILKGPSLQFYSGIMLVILGCVAFLTSIWRARVLKSRQFINFFRWITGYRIKK